MNLQALAADPTAVMSLLMPMLAGMPRFAAAFVVLPLLARAIVPRQIRIAFVLILVLVAYPGLAVSFPIVDWHAGQWVAFVVKEVFIGGLIGYAMGMVLWTLTAVGELMDTQAGYTNAQIFDPYGNHSAGPLSVLMSQLGVLLFVGFGGLQVFLQLLYESLLLWPPASFLPDLSGALRDFAIATSGTLLEVAARLAAPVLGALLLIELGVGLINRAAPQLNAFYFSMPIKALTGLLVLALLLSHLVDVVRQQFSEAEGLLPTLDQVWRQR